MGINRTQTYSALAGVGIMLGAAGLAGAATGGTTPSTDPTAPPTAVVVADSGEADGGVEVDEGAEQHEAPEQDEEVDGPDSADDDRDEQNESSYTSSVTVADTAESNSETDEQTQLAGLATVTVDDAGRAALAARPGTVTDVRLENENGNVVYSVIIDTGNGSVDVKVDAGDATVLTTEADDGDGEQHDGADDEQDGVDQAPGATVADD